jgi:precorrin-6A/cobalt-precorrin-6A reductase
MRVLILGGTSEASALARALAEDRRFQVTVSFAGRTQSPLAQPVPTRIGGFGGLEGLARYLIERQVDLLVDATHPFAAQMTRHAELAARRSGTPLLIVQRPPWQRQPDDRWIEVPDLEAAGRALGAAPRRVLLTIGQTELAAFAAAPDHHYVIRSINAPNPDQLPPRADVITARGPFTVADECALLRERRIELVVTKNSGGTVTEAKLTAARLCQVPVIIVARPPAPTGEVATTVDAALKWLERHHAAGRRGE